jgi:valyl-tRNA synthetase
MEKIRAVSTRIKETRATKGIKPREMLKLFIKNSESAHELFNSGALPGAVELLRKMDYLSDVIFVDSDDVDSTVHFMAANEKFMLEYHEEIDTEAEKEKLLAELKYQRGFVESINKKLSNERFVNSAPADIVDRERKKLSDGLDRIGIIEDALKALEQ